MIGLSYWQIPYTKIALPNALFGYGVIVAFFASVLIRKNKDVTFLSTIAVCGSAFPAVVLVRVIYDGVIDTSSHNLWPFEIIIATIFGIIVSAPGATIGGVIWPRFRQGKGDDEDSS